MEQLLDFVGRHGAPLFFATIFLDQLGVPIPTIPVLLALGALAGAGWIDPFLALALGVIASLCADLLWFQLGRWKGTQILGFLCRVSLEPDTCVSKTHDLFGRYGVRSLLVAKFIPGFDSVAPPLAGLLGVRRVTFVLWSLAGATLWVGAYGGLGFVFSDSLEELAAAAADFGQAVGVVILVLIAAFLLWKYVARQRVLRHFRMARITPDELYQMILGGKEPAIIDARSETELEAAPFVIKGARLMTYEEIDAQRLNIAREQEVVVYCSCPNEISSARLALKLQHLGIVRVRPLSGGIEAWRALNLPVVPR